MQSIISIHTKGGSMSEAAHPIHSLTVDSKDAHDIENFFYDNCVGDNLEIVVTEVEPTSTLEQAKNILLSVLGDRGDLIPPPGAVILQVLAYSWVHEYDVSLDEITFANKEEAEKAAAFLLTTFPEYNLKMEIIEEPEECGLPVTFEDSKDSIESYFEDMKDVRNHNYTRVHPKPDFSPGKIVLNREGWPFKVVKNKPDLIAMDMATGVQRMYNEFDFCKNGLIL